MKIPVIRGVIDRRILVNYRVDPKTLESLLPAPFRPKIINGMGMVGICLIRLKYVRPRFLPRWLGIASENAAHRAAVEWDDNKLSREGVYVRRRDTNSRLNCLAGGRVFPGLHHYAKFEVSETQDDFDIAVQSSDALVSMSIHAHRTNRFSTSSIFANLDEASAFFRAGSLGYSATSERTRFQGLELCCPRWSVEPLEVDEVHSNYFEDESLFPRGSIQLDSAILMRDVEHEWHGHSDLCCPAV